MLDKIKKFFNPKYLTEEEKDKQLRENIRIIFLSALAKKLEEAND